MNESSGSFNQTILIIMASVAVCIVSSLLFFAVGCLRHRYYPKQKYLTEFSSPPENQEKPQYQGVQESLEHVELSDNIAYVPVQLTV